MKQSRFGLVEFFFVCAITMTIVFAIVGMYSLNEKLARQNIQSDTTSLATTTSETLEDLCLYNDSYPNYELMEEVDASIPPQENPTREAFLARNCAMAKEYHRRKEALKQEEKRLYKAWCAAQDPSRMSFKDYKSCKRDI